MPHTLYIPTYSLLRKIYIFFQPIHKRERHQFFPLFSQQKDRTELRENDRSHVQVLRLESSGLVVLHVLHRESDFKKVGFCFFLLAFCFDNKKCKTCAA